MNKEEKIDKQLTKKERKHLKSLIDKQIQLNFKDATPAERFVNLCKPVTYKGYKW
jgi:hypothetical protein